MELSRKQRRKIRRIAIKFAKGDMSFDLYVLGIQFYAGKPLTTEQIKEIADNAI